MTKRRAPRKRPTPAPAPASVLERAAPSILRAAERLLSDLYEPGELTAATATAKRIIVALALYDFSTRAINHIFTELEPTP